MDVKERWDDLREIIRTGNERQQAQMWTSLPVKVIEDSDGFTVDLQPLIQGRHTKLTGEQQDITMPPLKKVPVMFSAGGGFTITHPIKKGDEGIAVFSARCIDNWWDKGDVQPCGWERKHHLSDAMYIPGIRSKPRKLGGPPQERLQEYRQRRVEISPLGTPASTSAVQIRSDDGKYFIELGPDGAVKIVCKTLHVQAEDRFDVQTKLISMHASEKFEVSAPTAAISASSKVSLGTPVLEVSGDIKAGGDIWAHAGVSGVGMSWTPIAPAASAAPKDIDPDSQGQWIILTNTPNLYENTFKEDLDYWIAVTQAGGVEYCPLGSTPGLDDLPIKDGDKIVWHADTLLFEQIKMYGWEEIDGGPPPDPDNPPPEEPWIGELIVEVTDPMAGPYAGYIPVTQIGDLFHIAGAINTVVPELSPLLNGAFAVTRMISATSFATPLTALRSQMGAIGGLISMSAPIRLAQHGHHGVRTGLEKTQKPVSGT